MHDENFKCLTMSDEEILKLSYRNPYHFGQLFDKHQKRFLRIAEKALRSEDDAEDVVQEAFVRIYKYGRKAGLQTNKFRPWSNAILRNCIADQISKYKNSTVSLTEEMENTVEGLRQDESQAIENKNFMDFVLSRVGNATAEIINLRYVLGKSLKEIARTLNISNGAARVRLYRSRKEFLQVYKQYNK